MSNERRLELVDAAGARRKLSAILSADVKGYSRLMGVDELGTHTTLKAYREIMDGLIVRHGGRVAGTAGDSVLADFPSVIEALGAAVDIQRALHEKNGELPPDRRLEFRVGINLGDVIVDGDDIYGDGVNVAARLQAIGEPGGITISGGVYDQVKGKLDLHYRDRGLQRVKNIREPIRVYSVGTEGTKARARHPARKWLWIGSGSLVVLLIAVGLLRFAPSLPITPWRADEAAVASGDAGDGAPTPASRLGDKPSIAVLPFDNRSGDPEQAYFSDGVTEDIITELGRFSSLLVMSWHAVEPYRDETVSPAQLRQDLNVRYLVDGSVRRAGERVRVTVQLTDAEQGTLLWSERYDERLEDVFSVQDDITGRIVGTLVGRLTQVEQERALTEPTDSLDAYDYVLRGRHFLRQLERSATHEARTMFERAVELDPRYAEAYVGHGWTHVQDFWFGWTEWPRRALEQALEQGERAEALDSTLAPAHALLAQVHQLLQQHDLAAREIGLALELNPNDAVSWGIRGSIMLFSGRPAEAIEAFEVAIRLDPNPFAWWLGDLAVAHYLEGRYEEAIRTAMRIGQRYEEYVRHHVVLAAAHAQLGHVDEAARAAENVRRLSPFFSAEAFGSGFADPEHREHLREGLQKAGLGAPS